ncbi:SLOG family protein [Streptomyces canus]|uniref:SLOG family protein n=1 Tax=Streptomyces canus TaxID=58343 RepID=UPI0038709D0D
MNLAEPRVLVCGDRQWAWSATVAAVLDRLSARHGDRLVVIEGAASGADHAAHLWCERNGLGADCHRCHPVDWQTARRTRPKTWRLAGPERNTRMQLQERPQVIAFLAPAGRDRHAGRAHDPVHHAAAAAATPRPSRT